MKLREYQRKRDFTRMADPRGEQQARPPGNSGHSYVIQKHAATRLHHDFRLEQDGVLLSWAVPKRPPTVANGSLRATGVPPGWRIGQDVMPRQGPAGVLTPASCPHLPRATSRAAFYKSSSTAPRRSGEARAGGGGTLVVPAEA